MYALSSLNAHSLTRGNRVLVARDEERTYSPNTLGSDGSRDRVMIVNSVMRAGQRVIITFMNDVIVGAGLNDKATVVL